ncbi:MAG: hypothetical protein M3Q10_16665 [Chloroflexota bacterium]|nr:hypothetical protein [Chloroflexota bacterium]
MSPADFLAELRRRGGVLRIEGDQLRCRAPDGVLTEKVVAYLRKHKMELIALLAAEAAIDPDGLRLRTALTLFDGEIIGDMAGDVSQEVA